MTEEIIGTGTDSTEHPGGSEGSVDGFTALLNGIGLLCYGFGVLDLGMFYLLDTDITGVWWSPIAAFLVGAVLTRIGNSD